MSTMVLYNLSLMLSMVILYLSSKWLVIWSLIELGTLSLVVLLSRQSSPRAVESTSKYFIVQSMAGVVLLLGMLCGYLVDGSLDLFSGYSEWSYLLILVGLLIKMAVFPNPFWFVDVVSGVGLIRGSYIVVFSKLMPVYLYCLLSGPFLGFGVVVVGMGSVVFGSVLGVNQTSVRKMVALSSVSHLGWLVLSFPVMSGYLCLFVFVSYVVMLLPLLWFAGDLSVGYLVKAKKSYYKFFGLLVLVLCLLSLGGFPPLLGFFYKWVMFLGLMEEGFFLVSIFLIFLSLVSLFFYLQVCYSLTSLYWPELKVSFLCTYFLSNSFYHVKSVLWGFMVWLVLVVNLLMMFGFCFMGPLSGGWFI